jgi:hypothetical protein
MDRKTARKYLKAQKLPSELRVERTYRTRPNPFIADWGGVVYPVCCGIHPHVPQRVSWL